MRICSFCNGLQSPQVQCPFCKRRLADGGPVDNYAGPYSPYGDAGNHSHCVHLLYCPGCGLDRRVTAPQSEI